MPKTIAELTTEKNKVKTKLAELQEQIKTEERQFNSDENDIIEALFNDLRSYRNQIEILKGEGVDESKRREVFDRNFSLQNTPEKQLSPEEKEKLVYRQAFMDHLLNGSQMSTESRAVLTAGIKRSMFDAPGIDAHYRGKQSYATRTRDIWKQFRSLISDQVHWGPRNPETRDQNIVPPAEGGYLVPEGFSNEITEQMKFFGGMREVARIFPTATGNDIPWPTLDDTANRAVIVAEGATIPDGQLTFDQRILTNYKYCTRVIRVSWELLQDSFFDFEAIIARSYAMRMGRGTNEDFTIGTGVGMPLGVVNGINTVTMAAGTEAGLTMDEINLLIRSIDRDYRNRPSTAFMFADLTEGLIYRLSVGSDDARHLWQPSFQEGVPDMIQGYRYVVNNDVPTDYSVGTPRGSVIMFGDWEHYIIRDIAPMTMRRLDELYAVSGQVGFLGWARFDGRPVFAVGIGGDTPIKGLIPPAV